MGYAIVATVHNSTKIYLFGDNMDVGDVINKTDIVLTYSKIPIGSHSHSSLIHKTVFYKTIFRNA